jgi:hypothetical protein
MANKESENKYERIANFKYQFLIRGKRPFPKPLEVLSSERLRKSQLKSFFYQSPIDIGFFGTEKNFFNMGDRNRPWETLRQLFEEGKAAKQFVPFKAVDKKAKTIIVKLHLDRGKEEIIRDIRTLLQVLDEQAKHYDVKFKRPKPHLDEFEGYLRVYDKRNEDPQKWTWAKIAVNIFPNEVFITKAGKEIPDPSAVDKVRNYYRQAREMIKGGWKTI